MLTYAQWIFSLCLWREGRGVSHDARFGMSWVIRNRVAKATYWGETIVEVCTHPFSFSGMTAPGDPNLVKWPDDNDTEFLDCQAIVQLNGFDPTLGAVFYWTKPLTEAPKEFGQVVETVVIDNVHFCAPA
jgi:hypothetical protein